MEQFGESRGFTGGVLGDGLDEQLLALGTEDDAQRLRLADLDAAKHRGVLPWLEHSFG
jgi:hypothetical protein